MSQVDRALVLTAGIAKRLWPLSLVRAKAAVPVAGVPLALRIIQWLGRSGIRDAVLNLHHRPASIAGAVGDGAGTGVRVRYSWEQPLLGSAGGPRKALTLLEADRFFIINGDTLTDVSLDAVRDAHEAAGALVTMALIPNPRPQQYGGVIVRDGFVRGFTRPGSAEPSFHFIGVQLTQAEVFAGVPDDRPSESVLSLYPTLMNERPNAVAAFVCDAAFDDVGTPSDYLRTCLRVAAANGEGPLYGPDCIVDGDATVTRSVLWDRVTVSAGARLSECVIADDVVIAPDAHFTRKAVIRGDDGLIVVDL
ncbi:MAG TPA: NDP-sugar synthase [Vicinamibacterales bacterium]|nr:NDP-sugar synthase [Vicinamibacterales bacterium]